MASNKRKNHFKKQQQTGQERRRAHREHLKAMGIDPFEVPHQAPGIEGRGQGRRFFSDDSPNQPEPAPPGSPPGYKKRRVRTHRMIRQECLDHAVNTLQLQGAQYQAAGYIEDYRIVAVCIETLKATWPNMT